jgi:hypothetical protein
MAQYFGIIWRIVSGLIGVRGANFFVRRHLKSKATINTTELLKQAFDAVKSFQPMDETHLANLISKTQDSALNGKYELFKTTAHFDTTARHPDWLGSDSPAVQQLAPQLPG